MPALERGRKRQTTQKACAEIGEYRECEMRREAYRMVNDDNHARERKGRVVLGGEVTA